MKFLWQVDDERMRFQDLLALTETFPVIRDLLLRGRWTMEMWHFWILGCCYIIRIILYKNQTVGHPYNLYLQVMKICSGRVCNPYCGIFLEIVSEEIEMSSIYLWRKDVAGSQKNLILVLGVFRFCQ